MFSTVPIRSFAVESSREPVHVTQLDKIPDWQKSYPGEEQVAEESVHRKKLQEHPPRRSYSGWPGSYQGGQGAGQEVGHRVGLGNQQKELSRQGSLAISLANSLATLANSLTTLANS
jgi:hypothetical protein